MPLAPGDRLGPYEIVALLGKGGMGEVYRGRDTRLGRDVALKVISPQKLGDQQMRRRFELEARAASALNHPSIVTIYDVGETDGMPWIAMEWVEGHTLRHALGSGPLPLPDALYLARQLADGLAAAHAKGIVHRDLKPANVMITRDGRGKILDFGLARQTAGGGEPGSLLSEAETLASPSDGVTREGAILGTVGYMSPEQAAGRPVDFRSDQFSFGLIVYEMLSGRRAFDHATPVETLAAVMRDAPPPLASLRPGLPPRLESVVATCIAKRPEDRFASTRELLAALEPLASGSQAGLGATLSALPTTRPLRQRLTLPRLGLLRLIGVALAIVLTVLGVRRWTAPRPLESLAVLPFENAGPDIADDYLGEGLTDNLIEQLSRLPALRVMARATVFRFRGSADPLGVGRELGVEAVLTGSVERRAGQISIAAELLDTKTGGRLWGERFDRPFANLRQVQDQVAIRLVGALGLQLSADEQRGLTRFGTDDAQAYDLALRAGQLFAHDNEEDDLEARQLLQQAIERDPRFVEAYLGLCGTYARAASTGWMRPKDAWPGCRAALAKAAAIDPQNPLLRVSLATVRYLSEWDWAATDREFRELADDPRIVLGQQFRPLAMYFWAIGRGDEAAALLERALRVDPGNLESRINRADYLAQAGRLDEAVAQYRSVLATDPNVPAPYYGLGEALKRKGDVAGAIVALRKAYELSGEDAGTAALADARDERDLERAEAVVTRARLVDLEALAKERYVSPLDIARLHAQLGERDLAFTQLSHALDDRSPALLLLKVDRAWDRIRDDPRFARLVARVGIP